MDEPCLFRSRDDARANGGLQRYIAEELPAVLCLARGARRDRDDFVHLVRFGKTAELRQHLERRVHGLGREGAPVEAAGAEADHLFLPVDHHEGQIGTYLHYYHMDRVRPDVDGRYPHTPTIMVLFHPATRR